jgi:hypothetical protein
VSPATILMHELHHSVLRVSNPSLAQSAFLIKDPQYGRATERAAITTLEQDFARANMEISGNQLTRENHSLVNLFLTNDSLSNRPINDFFPKKEVGSNSFSSGCGVNCMNIYASGAGL